MGVLSVLLGLPLAPVRVVIKVGELIQQQVEEELYHPASARRDLEQIEDERRRGELSGDEEARLQQQVLDRMTEEADEKER
ncbi:gas vesicle protein GvpG [Actinophytocola sp.]|uniref:gas vesicle protein GvpG n=1 Tax=Actinophytocola sp. TaxID=1872138 RepID=UPI003D6A6087